MEENGLFSFSPEKGEKADDAAGSFCSSRGTLVAEPVGFAPLPRPCLPAGESPRPRPRPLESRDPLEPLDRDDAARPENPRPRTVELSAPSFLPELNGPAILPGPGVAG